MELPLSDITIHALHAALRGLSARQRTIADNVANLETPQFLAGRVDFESTLQRALADGSDPLATVQPSFRRSQDPTNPNGNNVNLETETLAGMDTGLRYELASNALSDQFARLRQAIGS